MEVNRVEHINTLAQAYMYFKNLLGHDKFYIHKTKDIIGGDEYLIVTDEDTYYHSFTYSIFKGSILHTIREEASSVSMHNHIVRKWAV